MTTMSLLRLAALAVASAAGPAAAATPAQPAATADEHASHHPATPAPAAPAASMPIALPAPPPLMHSPQSPYPPAPGDQGMDMQMQGGAPPTSARDPHAYSGGYTLDAGPYALGGGRTLVLADEHAFGTLRVDQLEAVHRKGKTALGYDAQARIGRDYDKLVLKAEGDVAHGTLQDARTEVLWSQALSTYWDGQLGLRHDSGAGPNRTWLALGVQGLAPYWFEVDATAYLGQGGRSALRLDLEYELLLTQRWVLQPRLEANFYGKSDPARDIGKGLSDVTAGLRLRYEVSRQLAPYIGVEWQGRFGDTADLARNVGEPARTTRYLAGLRFWF